MQPMRARTFLLACFAGAALIGSGPHASAQDATTAVYNDWTLRCTSAKPPAPPKTCEMEQLTQAEGKTVSRVAIEPPVKGQPVKLVVQVPVNVSIADGVKIRIDDKDSGLAGPFTRCGPRGCFATIALNDEAIRRFRSATTPARIMFQNAGGQEAAIPMSFKGFGPAFDALK